MSIKGYDSLCTALAASGPLTEARMIILNKLNI